MQYHLVDFKQFVRENKKHLYVRRLFEKIPVGANDMAAV
jgi:hypothetical protein